MQPFVIPSIFTAVDKYSSVVNNMANATAKLNTKVETLHAKSERAFRKLTPTLSEASKQMMSMASTAAVTAGIFATAKFSADSIMAYESEIANLSAITGTSGASLDVFKTKIGEVAKATKESAIDVAKAFTQIGNNSPQLLQDANGLAEVTKQSIILAQASKMELAPAADALTTIMNQFNKPAKEAKSVIDLLAGGMVIGSTDIDKVADAMTRFGGVASQVAGVSLQESVVAIEAISDKMKDAEKIGTQFKNIFLRMSSISVQDPKALKDIKTAGVNIGIVESKTTPLVEKLKELKKLNSVTGGLEHVFGTENLQSLIPLLNSTDKYNDMMLKLTQSDEAHNAAQKMADKNNDTLSVKLGQLKNRWVNLLTSSDNATTGLNLLKGATDYVIENMDTIVSVGVGIIGFMTAWKILNIAMNSFLFINSVALGINNALKLESTALIEGNNIATKASIIVEKLFAASIAITTGNLEAFNLALGLSPVGVFILALGALALAFYGVNKAIEIFDEPLNKAFERQEQLRKEAFEVEDLRNKYLDLGMALKDAERNAINDKKRQVITSLVDAKMLMASPVEEDIQKGIDMINSAGEQAAQLNNFQFGKDKGQRYQNSMDTKSFVGSMGNAQMTPSTYDWTKPAVNPKLAQQQAIVSSITSTNKANATITIKNESNSPATLDSGSSSNSIMANTSSTLQLN